MTTSREWRLNAARRFLLKELERGQITISTPRKPGSPGGATLWAAAIALIIERKIVVTNEGQERIVRGPRPHTKMRLTRTLAKVEDDVI